MSGGSKEPFFRWVLSRFTTKAHFMRFMATAVLLVTVSFIARDKAVPDAWWGMFGMVFGFYFRGSEREAPEKCPHCGKDLTPGS